MPRLLMPTGAAGRQSSAVKQGGDLTQRHGDTEKQELHLATKGTKDARVILRWGSTPCPELQSITRDWPAFGVWGEAPAINLPLWLCDSV